MRHYLVPRDIVAFEYFRIAIPAAEASAVARDVVDALDRASLSGKRPISVLLAAEVLRSMGLA